MYVCVMLGLLDHAPATLFPAQIETVPLPRAYAKQSVKICYWIVIPDRIEAARRAI